MKAQNTILPKLCGGDLEFANFISGTTAANGTGYPAARLLLNEIEGFSGWPTTAASGSPGVPAISWQEASARDAECQDWGRKFLRSGGAAYVDLNHLELCTPETLDAFDFVASTHALYRLANIARNSANRRLPEGQRIHVVANNSDGQGNSYGSHLNVLMTRFAWETIFRRVQVMGFLASFHASSVIICGLGKVGSENGVPPVDYQCSQRADFMEHIQSLTTTHARGLLNTRHEPLCGPQGDSALPESRMARLHIICCDHNLCHGASLLKIGMLQIVLAMIEANRIDASLILEDPVLALRDWSHDPGLRARAPLVSRVEITAVDWQRRFLEMAFRFASAGGCDGVVPNAQGILELWADTLEKLALRRFEDLAGRLDWVLKRAILEQAAVQHRLDWDSPRMKRLDQLYSDLDPSAGLYWAYERAGVVERRISDDHIRRREIEPPETTRAWTRGELLGMASPEQIEAVDWDQIRFRFSQPRGWLRTVTVNLNNPFRFNRRENELALRRNGNLEAAVAAIQKLVGDPPGPWPPANPPET